jgi:hypothetical protein
MGLLTDPTVKDMPGVQRNFDALAKRFIFGEGSPEGNVKAKPGTFYGNEIGAVGSSAFVKTTPDSLATGWVPIA